MTRQARGRGAWPPISPPRLDPDLTIDGQMVVMKKVGVAEFKAGLSGDLAEVRRGERLVVCDRTTPIAWLVPYGDEDEALIVRPASSAVTTAHLAGWAG